MHAVWSETAYALTARASGPTVHLAADGGRGPVIEAACCGARSDQLGPDEQFTSDPGDVTCHQWHIWRHAVAWLGGKP